MIAPLPIFANITEDHRRGLQRFQFSVSSPPLVGTWTACHSSCMMNVIQPPAYSRCTMKT